VKKKYSNKIHERINDGSQIRTSDYLWIMAKPRDFGPRAQTFPVGGSHRLGRDSRQSRSILFEDREKGAPSAVDDGSSLSQAYGRPLGCPVHGSGSGRSVLDALLWGRRGFTPGQVLPSEFLFDDAFSRSDWRPGLGGCRRCDPEISADNEANRHFCDGDGLELYGEKRRVSDGLRAARQRQTQPASRDRRSQTLGNRGSERSSELRSEIQAGFDHDHEARKGPSGSDQSRNVGASQSGRSRDRQVRADDRAWRSGPQARGNGFNEPDSTGSRAFEFEKTSWASQASRSSEQTAIQRDSRSQESLLSSRTSGHRNPKRKKGETKRVWQQVQYLDRQERLHCQSRDLSGQQERCDFTRPGAQELGRENGASAAATQRRPWLSPKAAIAEQTVQKTQTSLYPDQRQEKASRGRKTLVQKRPGNASRHRSGDWASQTGSPHQSQPILRVPGRQNQSQPRLYRLESQQTGQGNLTKTASAARALGNSR